jgi:DNA-binding NarL/FixJ family response regulator
MLDPVVRLSPRDKQILPLIGEEGLACKEIAARLGLKHGTVKQYTSLLYRKLGIHAFRGSGQPILLLAIWYQKNKERLS